MPGLGSRLGRGGATTAENDLANSDCIVIMGSNMAENHPVAFRFVMKARERGAKVIHIDPRFSRTSAVATQHVRIRPGSDIAFLGGLINYAIEHETYFKEYVLAYTNAATLIKPEFQDTEDLDGVFSGFNSGRHAYDPRSWQYQGMESSPSPSGPQMHQQFSSMAYSQRVGNTEGTWPPPTDPTLQDPNCAFQLLKKHFARYTPEMVERVCGVPRDQFLEVARTISECSGRERTTAFCYAVGWTQHTTGPQVIGAAALLQLLMGNIGRPGGGIMALRGHASIQGSTDIPTLYDILPGYLAMPNTFDQHQTLDDYLDTETPRTAYWNNLPKFMVSLLKAYYGENATKANDYCYELIPKISGDYSAMPMFLAAKEGAIKGMFLMGENPAVGNMNAGTVREALASLDWLVVRDLFEIESANFWYAAPEVKRGTLKPEAIKTEVFLMPAAIVAEKDGTFTNTARVIQWHDRAVRPPGDATTEPWFLYHLGRRLRELYAGEDTPQARQLKALDWDYPLEGPNDEPVVEAILKEINGYTVADRTLLPGFDAAKADGSTACGCWIYAGVYPEEGRNLARSRVSDDAYSTGWGYAWPANRRILYNRAAADPGGRPWSERKKLVWWDAQAKRWTGYDVPDFPVGKAPDTPAKDGGVGMDALSGADPFIMMADGRGWLFAATGMRDGPFPTHYEPLDSPVSNPLYGQQTNPAVKHWPRKHNRLAGLENPRYPYAVTTYRLTEHHTAGGMSRWVPWLAELQPTFFAEISPGLAARHGIGNGDWVVVSSPRGEIEARALVTERMQPMRLDGHEVETVGLPYHWGYAGIVTGDAANDLVALVGDPDVSIEEAKAFTCNLRPGRRRA